MRHIKNIPSRDLAPGITGYYEHGNSMTIGYVELQKGSSIPLHHHVQEQITYILEGRMDMQVGGESCTLTAGMVHVIPSGTPHAAQALTDCRVIDAFSPAREDYRPS